MLSAFALGSANTSASGNHNCAHGVVSIGDSVFAVRKKCGEPTEKENTAGGGAEITDENWLYAGAARFSYMFHFQRGTLTAIQRIDR